MVFPLFILEKDKFLTLQNFENIYEVWLLSLVNHSY
jgi:hypothetical protein